MPEGVKVYFGESLRKKLEIEEKVKGLFKQNGYDYIELPTYEYYKDLEENFSSEMRTKVFKFEDRESGEVVALRPDMTSLLAKLIRLSGKDGDLQKRIFYCGDVFRHSKIKSGVSKEITQAGVELIGANSLEADIEIIVMAIESLKSLGITNPKVELGDVRIFETLTEKIGVSGDKKIELKKLIGNKDIPTLTAFLEANSLDKEILKLTMAIGDSSILDGFKGYSVEHLKKVVEMLDSLGYKENYVLDLGIVKEMGYYTGVVFNGFCDDLLDYILTGGRYDKMMGTEAIGFAINIDSVVPIYNEEGNNQANGCFVYSKEYKKACEKKMEFIKNGIRAEANVDKSSFEEAKVYAKDKNYEYIVNVDSNEKISLAGDM